MITPKIIALDLDGTLLSKSGEITLYTKEQIRSAAEKGITIVISTGRPFDGLPAKEALELGIEYAITANGAGIYRIADKTCLYEESLDPDFAASILKNLYTRHLHADAFIQGDAYAQPSTIQLIRKCALPESVKSYILTSRILVEDLPSYIAEKKLRLQKATLNFEPESDGNFIDREETKAFLLTQPQIHTVSGGYHNLEFTKAGVTKAKGLKFLCDYLNIPIESSMVCGDSENDLDILKAAGIAVAMADAEESVKAVCDYITGSCNEDGVGHAIAKFCFSDFA